MNDPGRGHVHVGPTAVGADLIRSNQNPKDPWIQMNEWVYSPDWILHKRLGHRSPLTSKARPWRGGVCVSKHFRIDLLNGMIGHPRPKDRVSVKDNVQGSTVLFGLLKQFEVGFGVLDPAFDLRSIPGFQRVVALTTRNHIRATAFCLGNGAL